MKKIAVLGCSLALAAGVMFGCSSGSNDAVTTDDAGAEAAAADQALVVDEAAKTITIQAVATGSDDPSVHFLANEDGSNAATALFTTSVTSQELYDALVSLGAEPGNNIAVDDSEGTIEGTDLDLTIEIDGQTYTPADLVAPADSRPTQARFGGNIDVNNEYGTGCLFCMESCSIGITSDSSYQYCEPMEFPPSENAPAAGTPVTVVYTVK